MGEWQILIKKAAALALVITAIAMMITILNIVMQSANDGIGQLTAAAAAKDMETLKAFDQTRVTGATILTAMKNYRNLEIAVIVKTGNFTTNYCAELAGFTPNTTTGDGSGLLTTATLNPDNQNLEIYGALVKGFEGYISPAARFDACLIYNSVGSVLGIYAEEKVPGIKTIFEP